MSRVARFSSLTLGVATAFVAVAWTTELHALLHAGFVALCVLAFLPFVIIAAILALMMAVGFVLGLASGGDVHASDVAGFAESLVYAPRGIRAYYRLLAKLARSVWACIPLGVLAGTLMTWGLLAIFVVPRELRTTAILLQARADIEQQYTATHSYPLQLDGEFLAASDGKPIADAFGQPLRYQTQGAWLARSYRLVSYGYDGRPSSDDLCVQGQTKAQRLLDSYNALASLVGVVSAFRPEVPMPKRFAAMRAVQCEHGFVQSEQAEEGGK